MDPKLRLLLAAANDDEFRGPMAPLKRPPFHLEVSRRSIFLQIGRYDAYLCAESEAAWRLTRENGGFDCQIWRLHLIVGRVPRPGAAAASVTC